MLTDIAHGVLAKSSHVIAMVSGNVKVSGRGIDMDVVDRFWMKRGRVEAAIECDGVDCV